MTARELYEYALIELNKLEAPSLLLEDYNYFINKAVQQYINLVYAKLEIDQQSTDDIRALKTSTTLIPSKISKIPGELSNVPLDSTILKSTYQAILPRDYMHLLNCVVEYTVNVNNFKCYNKGNKIYFAVRRLTSDLYTQILNNAYLRPMYKRPYYYIINNNTSNGKYNSSIGLNPATNTDIDDEIINYNSGNIINEKTESENGDPVKYIAVPSDSTWITEVHVSDTTVTYTLTKNTTDSMREGSISVICYKGSSSRLIYTEPIIQEIEEESKNLSFTFEKVSSNSSLIDSLNSIGDRLSNPSDVRLELRFGKDDGIFTPSRLYIDYLKSPMYIRLTQDQIDSTLDYSQVLEFPDYVCFEIANIFTRLLMENAGDPRLNTNIPINNTIVNPLAQQPQTNNK